MMDKLKMGIKFLILKEEIKNLIYEGGFNKCRVVAGSSKGGQFCAYSQGGRNIIAPKDKTLYRIGTGRLTPEFSSKDKFIKFTDEVKLDKLKNPDKYPKVAIPPKLTDVSINMNYHAKVYAKGTLVSAAGITSHPNLYNPIWTAHKSFEKHLRVEKFINSGKYQKVADKFGEIASSGITDNNKGYQKELAGLLYVTAITAQRIGASSKQTKAGIYKFVDTAEKNKNGTFKKKKVLDKVVDTYALTSLQNRHVTVKGDTVAFNYAGKLAEEQHHVYKDKKMAKYYSELKAFTDGKSNSRIHYETKIYHDVDKYLSKNANVKIHDFRTAQAHILYPKFRKKWLSENVKPDTKKDKKKMVDDICQSIADVLGNKKGEVRKTYAYPKHILEDLEG